MQNHDKFSWKEPIGYILIKLGQMVLKGVNWVHNDKIRGNGPERNQLSIQYKKYKGYLLRQVVFHFTEKSM